MLFFILAYFGNFFSIEEQHCEMTWMWPNFELILNGNYKLYHYFDGNYQYETFSEILLFLPGNKGSYKQVRSIGTELLKIAPYRIYSIDFNEEFSVFSKQVIQRQSEYLVHVIQYLKDAHPGIPINIMAHSMGTFVLRLALEHSQFKLNTIVTLASPDLAPTPIDPQISRINPLELSHISIHGGYRDMQVAPHLFKNAISTYELIETGVDHLAILWCNQLIKKLASFYKSKDINVLFPFIPSNLRHIEQIEVSSTSILFGDVHCSSCVGNPISYNQNRLYAVPTGKIQIKYNSYKLLSPINKQQGLLTSNYQSSKWLNISIPSQFLFSHSSNCSLILQSQNLLFYQTLNQSHFHFLESYSHVLVPPFCKSVISLNPILIFRILILQYPLLFTTTLLLSLNNGVLYSILHLAYHLKPIYSIFDICWIIPLLLCVGNLNSKIVNFLIYRLKKLLSIIPYGYSPWILILVPFKHVNVLVSCLYFIKNDKSNNLVFLVIMTTVLHLLAEYNMLFVGDWFMLLINAIYGILPLIPQQQTNLKFPLELILFSSTLVNGWYFEYVYILYLVLAKSINSIKKSN